MKVILAPLFAAILCLSLLAGCSSKKPIVGKWQDDKGMQVEFTKDGKLLQTMGGLSITATYTLPDDTHFKSELDMGGKKQESTVEYKVDGDTLTTTEHGEKKVLKRIK